MFTKHLGYLNSQAGLKRSPVPGRWWGMEESREAQEISVEMPEQVLDALLGGLDSLSIDRYIYYVYIYIYGGKSK